MLTTSSADGTNVRAIEEGNGPVILIVHGGSDDGSAWGKVAKLLAPRFRVVRIHRRQYRLDLDSGSKVSIAQEAQDVVALAKAIGEPAIIVGHSSGAVVALEALVRLPSMFAGAVLYEPPLVIGAPIGGEALVRAEDAVAKGKLGVAISIFAHDIVGMPGWIVPIIRVLVALVPKMRVFIPNQIRDCRALDDLGNRLDAYSAIQVPVLLLGGAKSPRHLSDRLDALGAKLPKPERIVMPKQGHGANDSAPGEVVRVIEALANKVLRPN